MSLRRSWVDRAGGAQQKRTPLASVFGLEVAWALRRHGPVIAFAAFDAVQVDAVQQHLQVGGADFHAAAVGLGETKTAKLQALVDNDITVLVPIEQLDAVAATIAKDKQLAGQRIALQLPANQLGQGIEAFAKIGGAGSQPNAHRGG